MNAKQIACSARMDCTVAWFRGIMVSTRLQAFAVLKGNQPFCAVWLQKHDVYSSVGTDCESIGTLAETKTVQGYESHTGLQAFASVQCSGGYPHLYHDGRKDIPSVGSCRAVGGWDNGREGSKEISALHLHTGGIQEELLLAVIYLGVMPA